MKPDDDNPNLLSDDSMMRVEQLRDQIKLPDSFFIDFARKHHLAVESLTEDQVAEAIQQAIRSGDFMRHITVDGASQSVTYIPFRELERVKGLYDELLYAVKSKHEGESRHETALRYIKEREKNASASDAAKMPPEFSC